MSRDVLSDHSELSTQKESLLKIKWELERLHTIISNDIIALDSVMQTQKKSFKNFDEVKVAFDHMIAIAKEREAKLNSEDK